METDLFFCSASSGRPPPALGQTAVVGAVLHQTLGSAGWRGEASRAASEEARWPGE